MPVTDAEETLNTEDPPQPKWLKSTWAHDFIGWLGLPRIRHTYLLSINTILIASARCGDTEEFYL